MKSNLVLKRVGAYFVDYLIITFVASLLVYISFINPKYDEYVKVSEEYTSIANDYYDKKITVEEFSEKTLELNYDISSTGYVYIIGDIVIAFLYFGLFAYFMKGQTIGKRLFNIKIVSAKDKDLTPLNYFIRTFILNNVIFNLIVLIALFFNEKTFLNIYSISSNFNTILMIVIFLMVMFYKDGRGLHDVLAGTKVIDMKAIDVENSNETETEKIESEAGEIIKPKKKSKKETK